jgi:hypothetical protein
MDVEQPRPGSELGAVTQPPFLSPLPEVDHLVPEGAHCLAIDSAEAELPGDGDFERIGAEMTVPSPHTATQSDGNGGEGGGEENAIDGPELLLKTVDVGEVARTRSELAPAIGLGLDRRRSGKVFAHDRPSLRPPAPVPGCEQRADSAEDFRRRICKRLVNPQCPPAI